MKTINKKFSELKSLIKEGDTLIGRIEQENIMFRWTDNYKYLDILTLNHLNFNLNNHNDMIVNVVDGFFSRTKKFDSFDEVKKLGYGLQEDRYVRFYGDKIYLEVSKTKCIDKEGYEKAVKTAWDNNVSTDFSIYFERVD